MSWDRHILHSKVSLLRWFLSAKPFRDNGSPNQDVMSFSLYDPAEKKVKRIYQFQNPAKKLAEEQESFRFIFDRLLVNGSRLTPVLKRKIQRKIAPKLENHAVKIFLSSKKRPPSKAVIKMSGLCEVNDPSGADVVSRISRTPDGMWEAYSSLYNISAKGDSDDAAVEALLRETSGMDSDFDGRKIPPRKKAVISINDNLGALYQFVLSEARKNPRPSYHHCSICQKPFRVYRREAEQNCCPADISQITFQNMKPDSRCKKTFNTRKYLSDPANRKRHNARMKKHMRVCRLPQ